ncbi:ferritin-like domain-containing protein [uncultured Sphingomonas sp.]|uniref:ferritin-like domain-containing protein n=1 Tax=uncultured Sphingomonas sp. TaxID=158754 RepID=UPI0035CBDC99
MATLAPDQTQDLFITGLKDAHGVEHQALALIDRQLDRLTHYPEVADLLRRHRGETEGQIARIEEILDGFDAKPSALKDAALTLSGNLAALAHTVAPDEIIKNSFANHAFENFEIAAYTGLLALVDIGGFSRAKAALEQSLGEEQRTAQLILESIPAVTRKFLDLRAAGEKADR